MVVNLTEVEKLLENPKPDYVKLLRFLCELERQYGTSEALLLTGNLDKSFWKDTKVGDLWKITKIADSITNLLILKLEKSSINTDFKSRSDLLKVIDINKAVNNRLEVIIEKTWPTRTLPTD